MVTDLPFLWYYLKTEAKNTALAGALTVLLWAGIVVYYNWRLNMVPGTRCKTIIKGDPAIPYGTTVEVISSAVVEGVLGVPQVYCRKVSSKDKQEYILLATELEEIK